MLAYRGKEKKEERKKERKRGREKERGRYKEEEKICERYGQIFCMYINNKSYSCAWLKRLLPIFRPLIANMNHSHFKQLFAWAVVFSVLRWLIAFYFYHCLFSVKPMEMCGISLSQTVANLFICANPQQKLTKCVITQI